MSDEIDKADSELWKKLNDRGLWLKRVGGITGWEAGCLFKRLSVGSSAREAVKRAIDKLEEEQDGE